MTVRLSISSKMLLLILPLICLPIAITGYFSIHAAVDRVNRLVRHEQESKVGVAAAKLDDIFEKLRVDLNTITRLPVIEDHYIARSFRLRAETEFNGETIARLFSDFLQRTPAYRRIRYLDETGRVLISAGTAGDDDLEKQRGGSPFSCRPGVCHPARCFFPGWKLRRRPAGR